MSARVASRSAWNTTCIYVCIRCYSSIHAILCLLYPLQRASPSRWKAGMGHYSPSHCHTVRTELTLLNKTLLSPVGLFYSQPDCPVTSQAWLQHMMPSERGINIFNMVCHHHERNLGLTVLLNVWLVWSLHNFFSKLPGTHWGGCLPVCHCSWWNCQEISFCFSSVWLPTYDWKADRQKPTSSITFYFTVLVLCLHTAAF